MFAIKLSLQSHKGAKLLRQNGHGSINAYEVKIGETSLSIKNIGKGDGLNYGHCLQLFMH
jgi:hypothetical protein